jgi:hypothetical protein
MASQTVKDLMVVSEGSDSKICFEIAGEPPVQKRTKMNYKARNAPTLFDPSSQEKIKFRLIVVQAMEEMNIPHSPFFKDDTD